MIPSLLTTHLVLLSGEGILHTSQEEAVLTITLGFGCLKCLSRNHQAVAELPAIGCLGFFLNIYALCGRLTEAGDSHQQPGDAELSATVIVKYSSYFSPHETRTYRPHQ